MLQSDEQRPRAPAIPVEFLLVFVRALIRAHPSQDLYDMAMVAADREVPLTTKQKAAFKLAVMNEAEQSIWPKGFF